MKKNLQHIFNLLKKIFNLNNNWMIAILVIIWCGFSNNFTVVNIIFGIVVAITCVLLVSPKNTIRKNSDYAIRFWPLMNLVGFTMVELVRSSLLVAWDVITPKLFSQPKMLEIDLSCEYDVERTLLANIISLTPGSLCIDLCNHQSTIKVHVMFAHDPQATIDYIKHRLEPKILKVFHHADPK